MRRPLAPRLSTLVPLLALLLACGGGKHPATAPTPDERPLAGLAALRIVVLPAYTMRVAPDLPWPEKPPRQRDVLRTLDADIAAELDARSLKSRWILPEQLVASYTRNPTYAADPYALALEPLRAPMLAAGQRMPDPLASQLRTMVALNDARLVLAPVEIRFERAGDVGTAGRAVLRAAVIDARTTETRWVGEVRGDTASAYGPAVVASVAARLVDLFVAP